MTEKEFKSMERQNNVMLTGVCLCLLSLIITAVYICVSAA